MPKAPARLFIAEVSDIFAYMFIKKAVKSSLDKNQLTKSYIIAVVFIILVALNVGAFMFFPKTAAPIAIILSNVITVLLMLFAIQPLNTLIQNELSKKAASLEEQGRAQEELRSRLATLEMRNHELESRLDTWTQMAGTPANVNLSFKLETFVYDKTGYVVKEEPLERYLEDPRYKISDKKGLSDKLSRFVDNLTHPGGKKVLYIGKYYVKASIGLDFTKVKFSTDGGQLALAGVRFTKLNDLAIEKDPEDVNHCWLLNEDGDEVTINQADVYRDFTGAYANMRSQEAKAALDEEVDALCKRYTDVFRANLAVRFPNITFCDQIEDSQATWYSLREHSRDAKVSQVAANMLLMADALSGYNEAADRKILLP